MFSTKNDAMEYVNLKTTWSCNYTNNTNEGKKIYFRCNQAKKREEQCPAGLYLLIKHDSEEVALFKTRESHQHSMMNSKSLSDQAKKEIEKLFDLNLKPKRMLEMLRDKGIMLKNKTQLNNYLVKLRHNKYGPNKISLGELENWCIEHSNLPETDNEAFVVAYHVKYGDGDDDDDCADDISDDIDHESTFRVFISTKKLLRNSLKSKIIHDDATYKLNWEGMHVLIVGISDLDRHFHPCGIAVCSNEKTSDFEFIFNSLKAGVAKLGEKIQL